jgi:hypothetical protein
MIVRIELWLRVDDDAAADKAFEDVLEKVQQLGLDVQDRDCIEVSDELPTDEDEDGGCYWCCGRGTLLTGETCSICEGAGK